MLLPKCKFSSEIQIKKKKTKRNFFLSSLRYSWGGQPLFVTCPPDNFTKCIPACSNCGSNRIFEFQLMPALVSMLQSDSGADL